jgi:hypothetical protein
VLRAQSSSSKLREDCGFHGCLVSGWFWTCAPCPIAVQQQQQQCNVGPAQKLLQAPHCTHLQDSRHAVSEDPREGWQLATRSLRCISRDLCICKDWCGLQTRQRKAALLLVGCAGARGLTNPRVLPRVLCVAVCRRGSEPPAGALLTLCC